MRSRLIGLRWLAAVLAAVTTLAGCGITSTGVVAFDSVPSGAATTSEPVPKGETAYHVYYQIGPYLEAETRVTKSGLPTEVLYAWLLAQIAAGPDADEIARGFSAPDDTLSRVRMVRFQPTGEAETIMVNLPSSLSGNDEGQIICTLNGKNLGTSENDAFGIIYQGDPTNVAWNNCTDFIAGAGGIVTASPPS